MSNRKINRLATPKDRINDLGREEGQWQKPADVFRVHAEACSHLLAIKTAPIREGLKVNMRFGGHVDQSAIGFSDHGHALDHDATFYAASFDQHRKIKHVVICRIDIVR